MTKREPEPKVIESGAFEEEPFCEHEWEYTVDTVYDTVCVIERRCTARGCKDGGRRALPQGMLEEVWNRAPDDILLKE